MESTIFAIHLDKINQVMESAGSSYVPSVYWNSVNINIIIENDADNSQFITPDKYLADHEQPSLMQFLVEWNRIHNDARYVYHSCHDPWNIIETSKKEDYPLYYFGRWIRLSRVE